MLKKGKAAAASAPAEDEGPDITPQEIHDALAAATTRDALDAACDLISLLPVSEHGPLVELYQKRATEIVGAE